MTRVESSLETLLKSITTAGAKWNHCLNKARVNSELERWCYSRLLMLLLLLSCAAPRCVRSGNIALVTDTAVFFIFIIIIILFWIHSYVTKQKKCSSTVHFSFVCYFLWCWQDQDRNSSNDGKIQQYREVWLMVNKTKTVCKYVVTGDWKYLLIIVISLLSSRSLTRCCYVVKILRKNK